MKRDLLIEGATKAFAALLKEDGSCDISMEDIAKKMGMNRTTLYRNGVSKDLIMIECIKNNIRSYLLPTLEDSQYFDVSTAATILQLTHKAVLHEKKYLSTDSLLPDVTTFGARCAAVYDNLKLFLTELKEINDEIFKTIVIQNLSSCICSFCETFSNTEKPTCDLIQEHANLIVEIYNQHLQRYKASK